MKGIEFPVNSSHEILHFNEHNIFVDNTFREIPSSTRIKRKATEKIMQWKIVKLKSFLFWPANHFLLSIPPFANVLRKNLFAVSFV